MRVADKTTQRNYIKYLNKARNDYAETNMKIASGNRFIKLSDDVSAGTRMLNSRVELFKSEKQLSNVQAINSEFKAVEDSANEKLLSKLPPDLQDDFRDLITENDAELRHLVKVADKISALIKCVEERKAGNTEFCEAEAATRKRICQANIPEADVFVEEFLPAYELTLDML